MTPSVLARQVEEGVADFLRTTFPSTNPFFHGIVDRLISRPGELFKGPYVSVRLPFRPGERGARAFNAFSEPLPFQPYRHQERAFDRLCAAQPRSTIVATGTGSGKTECFLYPILADCVNRAGVGGIKAIVIYPMNALATDQARRFAREIHREPNLRGKVRVGLYVGGLEREDRKVMGEDEVITCRDTMRLQPPDVLLTNYKMLDYLLLRPPDFPLWQENLRRADALRFVVVDELHTFDGAQGTDLACLLRRLCARLKPPEDQWCFVGTSATLGGSSDAQQIADYASRLSGRSVEAAGIVTEDVLRPDEFFADEPAHALDTLPDERAVLEPSGFASVEAFLRAQEEAWFRTTGASDDVEARVALGERLRSHAFLRTAVRVMGDRPQPLAHIADELGARVPRFAALPEARRRQVIDSILALVSHARRREQGRVTPFLQVRVQHWLRELRRMVAPVQASPEILFADDRQTKDLQNHLPLIHCRECGAMGWGGVRRPQDLRVRNDLQEFYRAFFGYETATIFLFPSEGEIRGQLGPGANERRLCGHCLALVSDPKATSCPQCGRADGLLTVLASQPRVTRRPRGGHERTESSHDCPCCGSTETLTILGSRAASLASVVISQLFGSTFNDDKKLLAFSDSVQDASHRAGFFGARTYRFHLRGCVQQFLEEAGAPQRLDQLASGFCGFWQERHAAGEYVARFLAPDMAWLEDYETLRRTGRLPEGSRLRELVDRRLSWEMTSEYGFNSRIGRTLEKSGCSVATFDREKLDAAARRCAQSLGEHMGGLRGASVEEWQRFLLGWLTNLKARGGIWHDALADFITSCGRKTYQFTQSEYMPSMGYRSRAPVFLTDRARTRFETIIGAGDRTTWSSHWLEKSFGGRDPMIVSMADDVFRTVLTVLVEVGLLREIRGDEHRCWAIEPAALMVRTDVVQFRCDRSGHAVSISKIEAALWDGMLSLRFGSRGAYRRDREGRDYYGRLYSQGSLHRVFPHEHTGLLDRDVREEIEKHFIKPEHPGDPNLLSCTPTLEMGINIGDLSSLLLCSIPPGAANYQQRIGRAGRTDGNAFTLALANGRPHDLYFFAEPREMIAEAVEPPGLYLDAPAVLERQLTAYCFDRWIETGVSAHAVPKQLGQVLAALEGPEQKEKFPFNLLHFIDLNRTSLVDGFIGLLADSLSTASRDYMREFASGMGEGGLAWRISNRLHEQLKSRESLQRRVKSLNKAIREKRAETARSQNWEQELEDLQSEKNGLGALVKAINEKDTYNFFTDEGLLPNYAFPEAGVILRSVILRQRRQADAEGRYKATVYEYERPASSAIHELAPSNHFYAESRRVQIDQIDLALSEREDWRFCDNCNHAERALSADAPASGCPACGSPGWADGGQVRRMVRMRQVFATTKDRASRSHDESDEREPAFFQRGTLVSVEPRHIKRAFRVRDDAYPFGFEFLEKATFREINFGRGGESVATLQIAGEARPAEGFSVCAECGKVESDSGELRHAVTCRHFRRDDDSGQKPTQDFIYLYRDYSSEALRLLLPVTFFNADAAIHTFVAALQLGLKRYFGGQVEHLAVCLQDEPDPAGGLRRRMLVLHDRVPGGTGYLKQLMVDSSQLMNVLQAAHDAVKGCSCQTDPEKDGCYRCLYAYRLSHDMADISARIALDLLNAILAHRGNLVPTERIQSISTNALYESELEARFVEALRRTNVGGTRLEVRPQLVRGKPGHYVRAGERIWLVELQALLGRAEGVHVSSKADFLFHPERETDGRPVAVFTDGFAYHADVRSGNNRVAADVSQRRAALETGRYHVWSLTWDDIDHALGGQLPRWECPISADAVKAAQLLASHAQRHALTGIATDALREDAFSQFARFLTTPDPRVWSGLAGALALAGTPSLTDGATAAQVFDRVEEVGRWQEFTTPSPPHPGDKSCVVRTHISRRDEGTPVSAFAAFAEAAHLPPAAYEKIQAGCRFFDDEEIARHPGYKEAWAGFLRASNLLQFLPLARISTSQGLASGLHAPIAPGVIAERESHLPTSDQEFQLVAPELIGVLRSLLAAGAPKPEIGYEMTDGRGEITAMAEIAWLDRKVALLTESQEVCRPDFERLGWRIPPHDAPLEEIMPLLR